MINGNSIKDSNAVELLTSLLRARSKISAGKKHKAPNGWDKLVAAISGHNLPLPSIKRVNATKTTSMEQALPGKELKRLQSKPKHKLKAAQKGRSKPSSTKNSSSATNDQSLEKWLTL